jgi:transcriptional regulator with XRE-family HTH domain
MENYTQKELNEIFGSRMKRKRTELKLTQKELGKKVNLSGSAITQYEKGIREPKKEMLYKLADVLEVDIDFFAPTSDSKPSKYIAVSKGVIFDLTEEITEVSQALIFLEMEELFFIPKKKLLKMTMEEVLHFANSVRKSVLKIKKM